MATLTARIKGTVLAVICLVLSFGHHCSGDGQTNGFLSFSTTSITVQETARQIPVTINRSGGTKGLLVFKVEIQPTTLQDFLSTSKTGVLHDAVTQTTVYFDLIDDNDPEEDEHYNVVLIIPTTGDTLPELSSPSSLNLTILKNDDANGVVSFITNLYAVDELQTENSIARFQITRSRGLFGNIMVNWEVVNGAMDVASSVGTTTIVDGHKTANLTVLVVPDDDPEARETFTVRLVSVFGGGRLDTDNPSKLNATLVVNPNDSPIRFSQLTYAVEEGTIAVLTVTRGIDDTGQPAGSTAGVAIVQYRTEAQTATKDDYQSLSGTVMFQDGDKQKQISVSTINDSKPEDNEEFSVLLFNSSFGTVLTLPRSAIVQITSNDDAFGVVYILSSGPIVLDEDDPSRRTVKVSIGRLRGNFSNITVSWEIREDSTNQLASADFSISTSSVEFGFNQSTAMFDIHVVLDGHPEEGESFSLQLTSVTGGGRIARPSEGATEVQVVILDSGDSYGVFTLADSSQQSISKSPRQLDITLNRTGGTLRSVTVNCTVTYLGSGVTDPNSGTTAFVTSPTIAIFVDGQTTAMINAIISSTAFLEVGGSFHIQITTVSLSFTPPVAPKSPKIGVPASVVVVISPLVGNGAIRFAKSQTTITEPDRGQASNAMLLISRDGAAGRATVKWMIQQPLGGSSFDLNEDVVLANGNVTLEDGVFSVNLSIGIDSDDEPELNEQFLVRLDSVIEGLPHTIDSSEDTGLVTILENDNPGGTFAFADASAGPFFMTESQLAFVILFVQRTGGALVQRELMYSIDNGNGEFNDVRGRLIFGKGKRTDTITISPIDDSIPELNETYFVKLTSSGSDMAVLGSRTSVQITILPNDDANGVVSFSGSAAITMGETPDASMFATTIYLNVIRLGGLFGKLTATWNVTAIGSSPSPYRQLSPVSGSIVFPDGSNSTQFNISSLADDMPEFAQQYQVNLLTVTGGAKLSSPTRVSLTVTANDDPVRFLAPISITVVEGAPAHFTVTRAGQRNGAVNVSYETIVGSADSSDFMGFQHGLLQFSDNASSLPLIVSTVNDSQPETDENFSIRLTHVTGDAVLFGDTTVTVNIAANDDPNGVIQFSSASLNKTIIEGSTTNFVVERQKGLFGQVEATWQVVDVVNGLFIPPGDDLLTTTGFLVFNDSEIQNTITITAVADGEPELAERYIIELTRVTGGARLSATQLHANLTILKNDDANGVVSFAMGSLDVDLPEDIESTGVLAGSVNVTVERDRGLFGGLEVLWDIIPQRFPNLAEFTDLFFGISLDSGVTEAIKSKGRIASDTRAFSFNGSSDSKGTVSLELQPAASIISSGFTLSAWVQPSSSVNGYIIAKAKADATTRFYTLGLLPATGTHINIAFDYLPSGPGTSISSGFHTVTVAVARTSLIDGNWHHLAVSVGEHSNRGQADFYFDGKLLEMRSLSDIRVADQPHQLVVGQLPNGNLPYVGLLQDVRVYHRQLTSLEVNAIGSAQVAADLRPITGYLTFKENVNKKQIVVNAVSDTDPEPDEHFSIVLSAVYGDARLSADNLTASLTLLRSDNGNGLFGFNTLSLSATVRQEPDTVFLTVERQHGTFDAVDVEWEVYQYVPGVDPLPLAAGDFQNTSGLLTFSQRQTSEILILDVVADLVPELAENFVVTLVSAMPSDGHLGSTQTSAASINPTKSQANVTIEKNDDPYGVLEFTLQFPPLPSDPVILPSTVAPQISVNEEDRTLNLTVVRANGLVGAVSAEYRTVDGSAVGSGSNRDFVAAAGLLSFAAGERSKVVTIALEDDATPELEKSFKVVLSSPSGSPEAPRLGVAKEITVIIKPSDDALGLVAFDTNSLSVSVSETVGTVKLDVVRQRGALGPITVYWEAMQGNNTNLRDFQPLSGNVTFQTGQAASHISIMLTDDSMPELSEVFMISLISVTGGGTLSKAGDVVAVLTIQSSDEPHGLFVFTPGNRPLRVNEANVNITLTVVREFGILGSVAVSYETVSIASSPNHGTVAIDYYRTLGVLYFADGETHKSFEVQIRDDGTPELDESVFLNLTSAILTSGTTAAMNSPRVGTINEGGQGEIIINENDDARGVLALSSLSVDVTEPNVGTFLQIIRTGGTFGTVTAKWQAHSQSATGGGVDFTPDSGTTNFVSQQTSAAVPITIINDVAPEFDEVFTVQIVDAGVARLGSPSSSSVTIEQNDDPNGAFEFSASSRMLNVEEPQAGTRSVSLTVQRTGGQTGVITLKYEVTLNGVLASDDVMPVRGDVFFLSGENRKSFDIDVLSDSISEGPEDITVTLTSVVISGAGIPRIGSHSHSVITILANDAPHGEVSFNVTMYSIAEGPMNTTIAYLTLYRSFGTVGELQVFYSTDDVDIAAEAAKQGLNVISFFSSPLSGFLSQPFKMLNSSLSTCAKSCLNDDACKSFSLHTTSYLCSLYTQKRTDKKIGVLFTPHNDTDYYEKDEVKVRPYVRMQAAPGMDYVQAINLHTTIADGSRWGFINITINPDNVPELDEMFLVTLNSVQLSLGSAANPANEPSLGASITVAVTISRNDEAYGVFRIISSSGQRNVIVNEITNLALPLTVERTGGTIGSVSIDWYGISGSAVSGSDFTAAGATLKFNDGDSRSSLLVSILDDTMPEINEKFYVALRNPSGGAAVSTTSDRVEVTISANDDVAGVIGFSSSSRSAIVSEGESFSMTVERRLSAVGQVTVYWRIEGDLPSNEFQSSSGSLLLSNNQTYTLLNVTVATDSSPETAELFTLRLYDVVTVGVPLSGAARILLPESTASLTIKASNEPHGQVEFDSSSLKISTTEGNKQVSLTLVRLFGSIGIVQVKYTAVNGSISPIQKDKLALASAGQDYFSTPGTVQMGDKEKSAVIRVNIREDSLAELDEAFLVNLTSVKLIGDFNTTIAPKLGRHSLAEVIISSNDGTRGELVFASNDITVSESDGVANVEILRTKGSFGDVTVFVYVLEDGARGRGSDFDFNPKTVSFATGETNKTVQVMIVNDNDPEIAEKFLLKMTNPTGGASVGKPDEVTVTISENDDPHGLISFLSSSTVTSTTEPASLSQSNSVRLTVIRQKGLFDEVIVQWAITGDAEKDLRLTSGAIVFADQESQQDIVIEVLADDIPEQDESYVVTLFEPTGGAKLGSQDITARLTIEANDNPNGIIQVNFNTTSASFLNVEEDVRQIKVNVKRSAGTFGRVTCQLKTQDGSATAGRKQNNFLATTQEIATVGAEQWHSFTSGVGLYVLLASSNRTGELPGFNKTNEDTDQPGGQNGGNQGGGNQGGDQGGQDMSGSGNAPSQSPGQGGQSPTPSPGQGGNGQQPGTGTGGGTDNNSDSVTGSGLYRWNGGGLERIQGINTNGAQSWTSLTVGSNTLVAVANSGEVGARETMSRIYSFADGRVTPTQDIPTKGATDVISFQSFAGMTYLLFANYQDDTGNRNIDSLVLQAVGITFSDHQSIATQGARSLVTFDILSTQYLAIANSYSTIDQSHVVNSQVFSWDGPTQMFNLLQNIPTSGAHDVHYFAISAMNYLAFCNGMDSTGDTKAKSPIYRWNDGTSRFTLHQEIETQAAQSMKTFMFSGNTYLAVSSFEGQSKIYQWSTTSDMFEDILSFTTKNSHDFHPLLVSSSGSTTVYLLSAEFSETESLSTVLLLTQTGNNSDYVSRETDIVFEEGVSIVDLELTVINDTLPEIDEKFFVNITNAQGGAQLGSQDSLVVTILTNDDAHGLIGFAGGSKVIPESDSDTPIQLNLVRENGTFGEVEVAWETSGTGATDVSPQKGTVTFAAEAKMANFTVTVLADAIPELKEVASIKLTGIVRGGVAAGSDTSRGAKLISTRSVSVITIEANDEPHGVVSWSPSSLSIKASEMEGANSAVTLTIVREFGTVGVLLVNYTTIVATDLVLKMQATPGVDFVSSSGVVEIGDNETTADVQITIKPDNTPEIAEYFYVNLTNVQLSNYTYEGNSTGPPPQISKPDSAMVVIQENDNFRGILVFTVTKALDGTVHVAEDASTFMLTIERTLGTFGVIGCSWFATPLSALGNGVDFGPSSGTLRWSEGDVFKQIPFTINNDNLPEIDETFQVELSQPSGGARIGSDASVIVTIDKNDDANGIILFDPNSQIVTVDESFNSTDSRGLATLMVRRDRGLFGTVNVQWQVESAGRDDLSPSSGIVTFAPNVSQQVFQIRAVVDDLPEDNEHYTVTLTSADGGATLNAARATIFIRLNGDANGIVSIDPKSQYLVLHESGLGSTGSGTVQLIREAGLFGRVQVQWRITPDVVNVFLATSGTVMFVPQQKNASANLLVLADATPELTETYKFELEAIHGGARLDSRPSTTVSTIVVTASDHPHGIIQFALSHRRVAESIGKVSLILRRLGGTFGGIRVNYSSNGTLPSPGIDRSDYSLTSNYVDIPQGVQTSSVDLQIIDDTTPELDESFSVSLNFVELISSQLNTSVINGHTVDIPPVLGSPAHLSVTISANDDPNGVIEFDTASSLVDILEDVGVWTLTLVRSGGTFGTVSVMHQAVNITALGQGLDYSVGVAGQGRVVFLPGQTSAVLSLVVINDEEPELQERFQIRLLSVQGGARLGDDATALITIAANDDPSGIVGFDDRMDNNIIVNNPNVTQGNKPVNLTVYRTAGDVGRIEISWTVTGPESGREFLDVMPSQGITVIKDGQRMGVVPLVVLADDRAEVEETFLVRLVSVAGGALLDTTKANITVTIPLHGEPFGVINFFAEALVNQEVREPNASLATVTLPVQRTEGTVGDILVFWSVVNVIQNFDITPTAGNVSFSEGGSHSSIQINILPDFEAELRETFRVQLTSASGGAKIGTTSQADFTVRANDLPHGIVGFSGQQALTIINEGSPKPSRQLLFGLQRREGTIGDIEVDFAVSYSQTTLSMYVPATGSVVIQDGQTQLTHSLNISANAFLIVGENFQITLTLVRLLTAGANDQPPELDHMASVTVIVPEISANSVFRFVDMSLQATVDDTVATGQSNVKLSVTRDGLFGNSDVYWQTGGNDSSVSDGSISPKQGILRFVHGESSKTFFVKADPSSPPSLSEVFVVRLTSISNVVEGGAVIDQNRNKAIIEPHGVITIATSDLVRVTEGVDSKMTLTVWRMYGSEGIIAVEYSTRNRTSGSDQFNAHNGEDFKPVHTTLAMQSGQTSATVDIFIVNNGIPEDNETFFVDLLSTNTVPATQNLVPSPRLIAPTTLTATITDDDNPHGVFSFKNSQAIVKEEDHTGSGTRVTIHIVRHRGLFGTVAVLVRTFGGGEMWTNYTNVNRRPTGQSTQVNVDYQRLNEEVIFAEGVSELSTTLVLYNDDIAELDENVYVELINPTGGARLGTATDHSQFNTVFAVLIQQNDEPNGLIGFQTLSVTLNEDIIARSYADIVVFRDRGDFGVAQVDWVAAKRFGDTTSLTIRNDFESSTFGTASFGAAQSTTTFRLQLKFDETPENGYSFIVYLTNPSTGSNIYNDRNTINVTVEASDDALGVFQFADSSRQATFSENARFVTLFIQRDFGTLGQATVHYATREAGSNDDLTVGVTEGVAAQEGVDYVYKDGLVEFAVGETQKAITISLGRQTSSGNIKVFFVSLSMPSDGTRLGQFSESRVRITPREESLTLALFQLESETLTAMSGETFVSIVSKLQTNVTVLNGQRTEDLNLFLKVLQLVSEKGSSYYSDNDQIVTRMMSIFNYMLGSSSFRGQSVIALTLQKFAFSLVAHDDCLSTNPRIVKLEETLLAVMVMRAKPADINTRMFTSRQGDTITLPDNVVKQNTGSSAECRDLYFLDFTSDNWFQSSDPIFNLDDGGDPHILSVGMNVESSELQNLENNVKYQINTERRVSPNSGECLFWNYDAGRWLTDSCSKQTTTSDQNYIVCKCNRLADFAARGETDSRVGWGPTIQVSCFVALVVLFIVWAVSHFASCCHQGGMLTAFKLVMHLLFALFITEIVLVVTIFESKSASIDSCAALGALIHYFGLAQFIWMMILSINLWQTLVVSNEETERYYFYYVIAGWLIPLVTLGLYMLIGKYQLDWKIEEIYGDVHGNGDLCFIPNVYAGLAAVVLPALLCLLVVCLVFTQAYQFPSRWKQYDDIYRNTDNRQEVPKLLLLVTLIVLVWIMGGLHLLISTTVTEILFMIFNIVLAAYVLFAYLFAQLKNMKGKGSYYPAETETFPMDQLPPELRVSHVSIGSQGSRRALIPDSGPWHDLPTDTPPPPLTSEPALHVSSPLDEPESQEFDDLIFALRTGGTLLGEDDDDDSEPLPDKSSASEHYEMRRISITDTRL